MDLIFGLLRKPGWRAGVPLALLWIALFGTTVQITGTSRLLDGALLLTFTTAGLLSGWLLARTRATHTQSAIGLSAAGLVFVLARLGGLDIQMIAVWAEALSAHARQALPGTATPMPSLVAHVEFLRAGLALLTRVGSWVQDSMHGRSPVDPVALNFVWGSALVAAGAWAGWVQRRHWNAAIALTPLLAIAALLAQANAGYPTVVLLQVGALLALLAFGAQAAREMGWEVSGIDYSEDIRLDLGIAATMVVALIITLAAVLPAISWRDVIASTRSFFDRIVLVRAAPSASGEPAGSSAAAEPATPLPFESLRATGLPRQHLIGSGAELARETVMQIHVVDTPPSHTARPYWRGLTFDEYTGHGWVSSRVESTAYRAGEALYEEDLAYHVSWRQEVTAVIVLGDMIYAAGDLNSVDKPFSVGRRSADDVFGGLVRSREYAAQSFVSVVGAATLESSSTDYPDWVTARYLDVPAAVPARVIALARDLTATAPNPYARARAIEAYLRTYTYTLDLPAPPVNRDIVDYFLFDLRRGYCDYYASAMVMLARAAGLPARLVVGYAPGAYDPDAHAYTVTAADAHSWPEVFFAGPGWVEFEPTAGRPPLAREPGILSPTVRGAPRSVTPIGDIGTLLRLAAQAGVGMAGILLAAGLAWLAADEWRLRQMTPRARLVTLYQRIRASACTLGVPSLESDTPFEFGARMETQLMELSLDVDAAVVRRLVAAYVEAAFSTHAPADATPESRWRLRWLVWRTRCRRRIKNARAGRPHRRAR